MFWQLARRVTDSVGARRVWRFTCSLWAAGSGSCIFSALPTALRAFSRGFTQRRRILWRKHRVGQSDCGSAYPQRATLFGWCVLFPPSILLWRFCYEGERRLWPWLAPLELPCRFAYPQCAGAGAALPRRRRLYTLAQGPHGERRCCPGWSWRRSAARHGCAQMLPTVLAQSLHGQQYAAAALQLDQRSRTTAR